MDNVENIVDGRFGAIPDICLPLHLLVLLAHLANEPTGDFLRLCPLLSFPAVTSVSDVQAVGSDAQHECEQGDGPGHYLRDIHQLKVLDALVGIGYAASTSSPYH